LTSPFTYGSLANGAEFLNRTKDKQRLNSNIKNKKHTTLISPRRWGKSSLVKEVSRQLQTKNSKYIFVFLDLFSVRNEEDFYRQFSIKVLQAGSSKTEVWLQRAKKFLQQHLPYLSVSLDTNSEVALKMDYKEGLDISEICNLPEKLSKETGKTFVICLDEFQNIEVFKDSLGFQKKLRSFWQHHKNAVYVFYGSKQHMMHQMFQKKSFPFYKFGDIMPLGKIAKNEWLPFLINHFKNNNKTLPLKIAQQIVETVDCHTQYVQQLAHICFVSTPKNKTVTKQIFKDSVDDLIRQNLSFFQLSFENLSKQQLAFLKMLLDGVESGFTTNRNLNKYGIKSSSAVPKIIAALEKKEIIDRFDKVHFSDPIFKTWLKQIDL